MHARKIIKRLIIACGLLIVLGYSFIALAGFVKGPRITVVSPKTGLAANKPLTDVAGHVVHSNDLSINDLPVSLDLAGNFAERLLLAPGYNIIVIKAKDRYGRTTEEKIETILNAPNDATPDPVQETINNHTSTTSPTE